MKAKEIYKLINRLIDIEIQLESAKETNENLINDKLVIAEALAPLNLKRINKALAYLNQINEMLLDEHSKQTKAEYIANNLFD
jgi:hypothetical protein